VLFILAVTELAVRTYWTLVGGSFADAPNRIHYQWYPELRGISASRDDGTYDVLLLGGSVLQGAAESLERALARDRDGPVRVHNVSRSAHTSLDSRSKYGHLEDQRFDLVLFYHAINEARANNCPPEVYRPDYGHYAWYRIMHAYDADDDRLLALPFTLRYLWLKLAPQMGLVEAVPRHRPSGEWLDYGSDVKTGPAYRSNLEWIVDRAVERGDPLVLLTFALYVHPGYSEEKFRDGELGLEPGGNPTALWGRPAHVEAAVEVHNRELLAVGSRPEVDVIDMRAAVPLEGRYWRDICHYSDAGKELWAEHLVRELKKLGR
jgi:hypothetical protein